MNWAGGMDRKKDFRSRCYHAVAPIAVAIEEVSPQVVCPCCSHRRGGLLITDAADLLGDTCFSTDDFSGGDYLAVCHSNNN